jgi:hypothetical protein
MEEVMTEKREKTAAERLAERLAGPIPLAKPKPKPLPEAELVPLDPWPLGRRGWTPEVEAKGVGPTVTIRWDLVEMQRANAEIARAFRRSRDPFGVGLYGHETMDELVRRQNGED